MANAPIDISSDRTTLDQVAQKAMTGGVILAVFGIIATAMVAFLLDAPGGDEHAGDHGAGSAAVGHDHAGEDHAGDDHGAGEHGTEEHGAGEHDSGDHAAHGHHLHGHISQWSWAHPYLVNAMFFLSITLGALFFVIIHHLTRAGWSTSLRRLAEGTSLNFFLLALLFIPLVIRPGADLLYQWLHVAPGEDELIDAKSWWLTYEMFTGRMVLYFVIWGGLALTFHRLSVRQDETGDPLLSRKMGKLTPVAILLFAITVTLASFDLLMSLDAHWFSTMFGVYFFAGCVLSWHAFLALLVIWLQRNGRLEKAINAEHLQDVGKMVFAFTVFWAYVAFSQYMLYWYANIPEETGWYLRRQEIFGWGAWGFFLLFGHFAVPFLFLLSRHVKRRRATLAIGCAWMLVVHWCDLYYLVMPQISDGKEFPFTMLDVTIFLAMGGVYLASTAWWLRQHALIPVKDPKLPEALAFHNV